jgi:hypothetical protein
VALGLLVFLVTLLPVVAWGMWLAFCWLVAKKLGVEGLKATPPVAKSFPVHQWMEFLRQLGRWIAGLIEKSGTGPPGS